ncbi:hypothetical protein [Actinoplanes sp. NPDC023714]|uniref:hypothetical protein n=1 Tax=Actinoplanes sp. NPDC023714 TaxID=3154322 RepID=UPI0033EA097D
MIDDHAGDRLLERLIRALAAQVAASPSPVLAPGAVAALGGLSRAEARTFYGAAGHRVHYETDTEGIATLIDLVSAAHRFAADPDTAIRPGDAVHVADVSPREPDWFYTVRFVGDDGTVDVQPELRWNTSSRRCPRPRWFR